jgi:hypothetical protein
LMVGDKHTSLLWFGCNEFYNTGHRRLQSDPKTENVTLQVCTIKPFYSSALCCGTIS